MAKKKTFPTAILLIPVVIFLALAAKYLYFYTTPSGLIGANHYQNLLGEKASCAVVPSGPNSCFSLPCFANMCIITQPFGFNSSESGNDETVNWKTYINNSYGYSINYPSVVTQETKTVKVSPSQIKNNIHDYFKTEGGTLEIYGVCGRGVQPIKQTDIFIGSQKAIKLYETTTSGVITAIHRTNSKEYICFNFTLSNDPIKADSTDKLFDKILSTFKFTE